MNYGIAFHYGQLPHNVRIELENLYKLGQIDYLFTTSTILEGVNLPAENIFILTDWKGKSKFRPIDFWNLAGRAGRLTKELSGNIICIKKGKRDWTSTDIFKSRKNIKLSPRISFDDEKQIDAILNVLSNKIPEKTTQKETQILEYLTNVLKIDLMSGKGDSSLLVKKMGEKERTDVLDIAKDIVKDITIPVNILNSNPSIKVEIQEKVYKIINHYKDSKRIILTGKIDYDRCLSILNFFYKIYEWENEEADLKHKNSLKYFATLLNVWMNGASLNEIINSSITYNHNNNREIFPNRERVKFKRNDKEHINYLINEIIKNIDKILRFNFEKYFNNYFQILSEVVGEDNAGKNWAVFIEYGSKIPLVIALQNLGFSRHTSLSISSQKNCFNLKNGKLVSINKGLLSSKYSQNSIEYNEISKVL